MRIGRHRDRQPLFLGTLKAAFLAMLFATPLAVLAAIYTSEFASRRMREIIKPTIELLAGVPSVVLGFLFGHFYQRLPGRTGVMKGVFFGFAVWIAMSLTFFPAIGKGLFATQTGLGIAPTFFTLAMVLTYSATLGVAYSLFTSQTRGRAT